MATIGEALEMINRGETPEQYRKRKARLRKLTEERDFLEDGIELLGDDPRAEKKRKRLEKVKKMIEEAM